MTELIKSYLTSIVRVLMGALFLLMGLNGFFFFMPQPADLPTAVIDFNVALISTGYLFQFAMGTQVVVGIMLLLNRFVPLALALIAPVILNIVAFHIFLFPSGLFLAVVVLILELYLVFAYRKAFTLMLKGKNESSI